MKIKSTAYHEAGHCVIGYLIQPTERMKYSTIIPFERDGKCIPGTTCWEGNSPTEDKGVLKVYAGSIAERLFNGEKPANITLETEWKVNAETGEQSINAEVHSVYNYDLSVSFDDAYAKTRDLLLERWAIVGALAEALFKAERLEGAEVTKIIDTHQI